MDEISLNLDIQRLGECRVPSPMSGIEFVTVDDRVLYHSDPKERLALKRHALSCVLE